MYYFISIYMMGMLTTFSFIMKFQSIYDETLKGPWQEKCSSHWYVGMVTLWPITFIATIGCLFVHYSAKFFDKLRGIK